MHIMNNKHTQADKHKKINEMLKNCTILYKNIIIIKSKTENVKM